MPVIFRYKGFRFFFFSNEGNPREPLHIHAQKAEKLAKFWLNPEISLAEAYGLTSGELRDLAMEVKRNAKLIEDSWNEYFED